MCIGLRIDVNILNAQGATPLHLTCSPDVIEVIHTHTRVQTHKYKYMLTFIHHACVHPYIQT